MKLAWPLAVSRRLRDLDWATVILVVAFLVVAPLPGVWRGLLPWLLSSGEPRSFVEYDSAIRAAAIKTPATAMALTRLDPDVPETEVVKFGYIGTVDGKLAKGSQLKSEIFVALPAELKERCKGAADPQAALQRMLGLPPSGQTKPAWLVKFPTRNIFRPCLSTDSIAETTCLASPPSDTTALFADETKHRHFDFVAGMLMKSYHLGFSRDGVQPNDYPYDGYPFTGMGYTYNWGSPANGHFGVSEFVVERGTIIGDISPVDLASYCATTP
jgi:hypothetical protein